MVKKSTYVMLAILVVLLLLLIADPSQSMETVYLCTKMTYAYSHTNAKYPSNEWVRTFSYDPNGNILSVEETSGGETFEAFRFTYDYQNNVLSEIGYTDKGKEFYCKTYTYSLNETTMISETTTMSGKGLPVDPFGDTIKDMKAVYTYDSYGNPVSTKLYYRDWNPYEIVHTYDHNGNILTETHREGDSINAQYQYAYDIFGRCITCTQYNGEKEVSRQEFFHDIWGNQTIEKYYSGNTLWSQTKSTYDFWGNLVDVLEVYDDKDQNQVHITYEYDSVGNITKTVYSSTSMKGNVVKEYAYMAVQLPAEQAKKIREVQQELLNDLR